MQRISQGFTVVCRLVVTVLVVAACDKVPAGPNQDAVASGFPTRALTSSESSIPHEVTDAGKARVLVLIPGMPNLSVPCSGAGSTVTGIAFDGTYIYVAHGSFVNSCITRYTNSGTYVDQKNFRPDSRGLTWVPGLGKLVARTFGGTAGGQDNPLEQGRFFSIDYAAGTAVLLTNYNVQPGNDQGQPGVDPDGSGYWISTGGMLEHHRMSDGGFLNSVPAVQGFPGTDPVSTASPAVAVPINANTYNGYDRASLSFLGSFTAVNSNGCSGFGVGFSGDAQRVGINLNCTVVTIEATQIAHAPQTPYPSPVYPGHIILCKNISSPAGANGYVIGATGILPGDIVISSTFLVPGQCKVVFLRTGPHSDVPVTLTITEFPATGTEVGSINRTQFDVTTTQAGPSPTITVQANTFKGGLVVYNNVAAPPG